MNQKYKENMQRYINMLPIVGLITSIIEFIMFFLIFKVTANFWMVSLYCLLPIFIFTSIYLFAKLTR